MRREVRLVETKRNLPPPSRAPVAPETLRLAGASCEVSRIIRMVAAENQEWLKPEILRGPSRCKYHPSEKLI
jgi:hypothetical protein